MLDTLSGKPGAGVRITFEAAEGEGWRTVKTLATNVDGRTDEPLLVGEAMAVGRYRIVFHMGEYFVRFGVPLASPPFLDRVPRHAAPRCWTGVGNPCRTACFTGRKGQE